jgi:hypothetical protein
MGGEKNKFLRRVGEREKVQIAVIRIRNCQVVLCNQIISPPFLPFPHPIEYRHNFLLGALNSLSSGHDHPPVP